MNENQPINDSVAITLKRGDGSIGSLLYDGVKITGMVHVQLFGPDGALKDERYISNLVVTSGKGHIASLLQNRASVNEMTSMALGTGASGPAVGDTDLGAEITTGMAGTRASVIRSNPTSTTILYASTWSAGQSTNAAITEAGTFNASAVGPASGTMLDRVVFAPVAKGAGDALTVNWTVTIS